MTEVLFISACVVGLVAAWVTAIEPGQIFQEIGRRLSAMKEKKIEDDNGYTDRHSWADLWSCPYCLSWWVGAVVGGVVVIFGNWYGLGMAPICWLMVELKDRI